MVCHNTAQLIHMQPAEIVIPHNQSQFGPALYRLHADKRPQANAGTGQDLPSSLLWASHGNKKAVCIFSMHTAGYWSTGPD
jgi:hypothetical protein